MQVVSVWLVKYCFGRKALTLVFSHVNGTAALSYFKVVREWRVP